MGTSFHALLLEVWFPESCFLFTLAYVLAVTSGDSRVQQAVGTPGGQDWPERPVSPFASHLGLLLPGTRLGVC